MLVRKQISLFILTILLSFVSHAQHSISKYALKNVTDPIVPLITNRVIDTIHDDLMVLENEIDDYNPLKVFIVEASNDSIQCDQTSDISLSGLFKEAGNDWLLMIHGDSKTPIDAAVRGLDIQNLHDVKVIVFSWPSMSDERNGLKNFSNSQNNVQNGLIHFRELLLLIQKYKHSYIWPKENKLSLMMHSLGNYYLELAVKENMLSGIDPELFDNVIINAAAVNQEAHDQWVENLHISKRIYIISNAKDFNLRGAQIFTKSGKQLGGSPKHPLASNAIYIDFTKAVGFTVPIGDSHTYFVGEMPHKRENIKRFYTEIFHGEAADLSNSGMFSERYDGLGYDIIIEL